MGHNMMSTMTSNFGWNPWLTNKKDLWLNYINMAYVAQSCDYSYNRLDNLSKFAMCRFVT